MTRVKGGVHALKRRRTILKQVKGFRHGRKSKERMAKDALLHAGLHAFHDRRKKKRNMRTLWQVKINAMSKENGISYSKLINKLKIANVKLDRKILSQLAEFQPTIFSKIVAEVK